MTIRINGEEQVLPADPTIEAVLDALALPRRDVAVAVDGAVVPRSRWTSTQVADGSSVEVVTAMQGG